MKEIENVVIRFSGDSGDGMQLTGTQFSSTSALMGNDISTFPDFPAEIRAPQGTVAGVSGFQVNIGSSEINTPGDEPFVLVAMNPAALKANQHMVAKGGVLIINTDAFTEKNVEKAGYTENPLDNSDNFSDYQLVEAPITSQTLAALEQTGLDTKSKSRCKNFYALGMTYFMFSRNLEPTIEWIGKKFGKKPELAEANILALKAGRNFAENVNQAISTYQIQKADISPGTYRFINGNTATAWGFLKAQEASGLNIFLGSYPITPATDILHELAKHKDKGVKTFQAEDEIAGVCSAIGASFAGALALTTSSGPGIALKGEALGLAVMYELPLVCVNVQRGGPSTGLPTKTEQSDLLQCMYGRNGESPMVVVAAHSPSNCFHMAYEASRLALEHMTPVMLLTDGFIANGSEPWKLPDLDKNYQKINTKLVDTSTNGENFLPYNRDENLARNWAIPGMKGFEHRLGGLEKQDGSGNVSYDPENHEKMCHIRQDKVNNIAKCIPAQEIEGEQSGDLLVVSWGGTYGATHMAVKQLRKDGHKVALMHIDYISPMPENVGSILSSFKKVLVAELNLGQMHKIINGQYNIGASSYTKVQGLPFKISELVTACKRELETI